MYSHAVLHHSANWVWQQLPGTIGSTRSTLIEPHLTLQLYRYWYALVNGLGWIQSPDDDNKQDCDAQTQTCAIYFQLFDRIHCFGPIGLYHLSLPNGLYGLYQKTTWTILGEIIQTQTQTHSHFWNKTTTLQILQITIWRIVP